MFITLDYFFIINNNLFSCIIVEIVKQNIAKSKYQSESDKKRSSTRFKYL